MENTEEIWKCELCDLQKDSPHYPQIPLTATAPTMSLRCGHIFHTHCMLHSTVLDGVIEIHARCPNQECGVSVLNEDAINFYRRREGYTERNIVKLWRENATFREELQDVFKARKEYMKAFRVYAPKVNIIKKNFFRNIIPYKDAVKYEREEAKRQICDIPEKGEALRYMNRFSTKLKNLTRKYDIWSGELRQLRGIKGAPKIPLNGRIGVKYGHRYGIYRGNTMSARGLRVCF
jgi:hypothetical protein